MNINEAISFEVSHLTFYRSKAFNLGLRSFCAGLNQLIPSPSVSGINLHIESGEVMGVGLYASLLWRKHPHTKFIP